MKFFKESQFNNQSAVDYYFKKSTAPNKPLWFNVKVWLESFTKQLDSNQAKNIINPFNFDFPVFGYDWQVHAWTNKSDTYYSHPIKSYVHENGYAIDFASNNHVATYLFFRYLKTLQERGAKFRVLISLHNHHIHIDNYPPNFGYCGIEYKEGGNVQIREYDENRDNDVRKHYNVELNADEESSSEFDKFFDLNKGKIFMFTFFILALLILFKKKGAN